MQQREVLREIRWLEIKLEQAHARLAKLNRDRALSGGWHLHCGYGCSYCLPEKP